MDVLNCGHCLGNTVLQFVRIPSRFSLLLGLPQTGHPADSPVLLYVEVVGVDFQLPGWTSKSAKLSQLRAAFDRVHSGAPKGSIGRAALEALQDCLAVNQVRKRSLWEFPECGYCYQLHVILGDRPRLRARSYSHPTARGGIRVQVESNLQLVELVKRVPSCAQRLSGLLIERLQLLHR